MIEYIRTLIIMFSYLNNRHYHILTKQFPDELKIDQPKVVYLPAHNGQSKVKGCDKKNSSKLKLKRSRQMILSETPVGDCCPICFSGDNISVQYHGKKHVCVKCRKLMRDQFGNQIRIFLNESGEILCLGLKVDKNKEATCKTYYYTDYTKLQINGRSAFATFAKPDEMVVILRNSQNQ